MALYLKIDTNLSITDVLNELQKKEYNLKFRREATCLYCNELRQWILPEHFKIDVSYYFEEIDTPDADRMLYAICLSKGTKGFLVDACNVYTDAISPEMMHKLNPDKAIDG